jgi:hypothetical protein
LRLGRLDVMKGLRMEDLGGTKLAVVMRGIIGNGLRRDRGHGRRGGNR